MTYTTRHSVSRYHAFAPLTDKQVTLDVSTLPPKCLQKEPSLLTGRTAIPVLLAEPRSDEPDKGNLFVLNPVIPRNEIYLFFHPSYILSFSNLSCPISVHHPTLHVDLCNAAAQWHERAVRGRLSFGFRIYKSLSRIRRSLHNPGLWYSVAHIWRLRQSHASEV